MREVVSNGFMESNYLKAKEVFEKHGWSDDEAASFARKSVKIANGAEIAQKVPVIGFADCTR